MSGKKFARLQRTDALYQKYKNYDGKNIYFFCFKQFLTQISEHSATVSQKCPVNVTTRRLERDRHFPPVSMTLEPRSCAILHI